MNAHPPTKRIVYLDRSSLPTHIDIPPPLHPHEWVNFSASHSDQIVERCIDADVIVTNKVPVTKSVLNACPRVRHIAVTATGYNIIDIDACQELGVSVSNIPSYAATTVSEHVIMCALTLRRELNLYRHEVINDAWQSSQTFCLFDKPIHDLAGCKFGVIGFGQIGRATAKLANALGMNIVYHSRTAHENNIATQVSFAELISTCDVISVHCSLNEETENLIGTSEIAKMQAHTILINTARGGIVNETEVVKAINDGKLGGIAFDVLATEPPNDNSPLLSIAKKTNVIITPHIAWASEQAMQHLVSILSSNIDAFLNGKPQNVVV